MDDASRLVDYNRLLYEVAKDKLLKWVVYYYRRRREDGKTGSGVEASGKTDGGGGGAVSDFFHDGAVHVLGLLD